MSSAAATRRTSRRGPVLWGGRGSGKIDRYTPSFRDKAEEVGGKVLLAIFVVLGVVVGTPHPHGRARVSARGPEVSSHGTRLPALVSDWSFFWLVVVLTAAGGALGGWIADDDLGEVGRGAGLAPCVLFSVAIVYLPLRQMALKNERDVGLE
jgi:hypothetical protein